MIRAEQTLHEELRRERDPETYDPKLWFRTIKLKEKPITAVTWIQGIRISEKLG